jgi:hypothetical protein
MPKPHKEVKIEKIEKLEKPEFKEFKDHKLEKLEKNEIKEHKDHKIEKLEKNELKEHKDHKIEKLEKNELKEHKDHKIEKIEKIEVKEFSKLEHGEKPPGKEKDGKEIAEGPGSVDPIDPAIQGLSAAGRGQAQHFINPDERPDLSGGALSGEPDNGQRAG